jgi:hypothetical protein
VAAGLLLAMGIAGPALAQTTFVFGFVTAVPSGTLVVMPKEHVYVRNHSAAMDAQRDVAEPRSLRVALWPCLFHGRRL